MGYKIRFQRRALNDLERLVRFITLEDTAAATRFGYALVQAVENLANAPARGRAYDLARGIRSIPFPPFRAYYRVKGEALEVLKLWHGARRRKPRL